MKQPNLKRHGIRNVTAINWHLLTAALYAKIAPRGETSHNICYYCRWFSFRASEAF